MYEGTTSSAQALTAWTSCISQVNYDCSNKLLVESAAKGGRKPYYQIWSYFEQKELEAGFPYVLPGFSPKSFVTHGAMDPYVGGNLTQSFIWGIIPRFPLDYDLQRRTSEYLVNYAKGVNPSRDEWPAYNDRTRYYLDWDDTMTVKSAETEIRFCNAWNSELTARLAQNHGHLGDR
jgi:carboxylesterase type B